MRLELILPAHPYAVSTHPTNPFTILEPQDQEISEFYVVQERHTTDFKAPKLWMGSSGSALSIPRDVATALPTLSQL